MLLCWIQTNVRDTPLPSLAHDAELTRGLVSVRGDERAASDGDAGSSLSWNGKISPLCLLGSRGVRSPAVASRQLFRFLHSWASRMEGGYLDELFG